jgi:hypothetical protein
MRQFPTLYFTLFFPVCKELFSFFHKKNILFSATSQKTPAAKAAGEAYGKK